MKAANEDGAIALSVSEEDLQLYAAGELDSPRRRQIEGLLACNPDLAAQVMRQLHRMNDGQRRAARPPSRRLALAGAFTALGVGLGLLAALGVHPGPSEGWREADGDAPPVYVTEAAASRQAALVRARMVSQVETTQFDAAEIRKEIKVSLPILPNGWRIIDVQVFPTNVGPSINLVMETAELQRLDLFAVRADTLAGARPEIASRRGELVAFWEEGDSAYVLSGDRKAQALLQHAIVLARRTSIWRPILERRSKTG